VSALTYASLQTELLVALAQAPPPYNVVPPDFASLYPRAISYAESRICQEVPLLANRDGDRSLKTTAGSRLVDIDLSTKPTPILVVEGLAVYAPLGQKHFEKTTLDFIDLFWPDDGVTMDPGLTDNIGRYWTQATGRIIVIVPTPDAVYDIAIVALYAPPSLSIANPSTYLSTTYPDLLVSACMVFMEGTLRRNFGAQADDPKSAMSWEGQYQTLKAACAFEEARRRGIAPNIPHPGGKAA
jgi:hypothetical protein